MNKFHEFVKSNKRNQCVKNIYTFKRALKPFCITALTILSGCVPYYNVSEIKITYEQKGKDCVYTEKGYAIAEDERQLVNNDSITYSNTNCSVIINKELENNMNKKVLYRRVDSADVANSRLGIR